MVSDTAAAQAVTILTRRQFRADQRIRRGMTLARRVSITPLPRATTLHFGNLTQASNTRRYQNVNGPTLEEQVCP